MEWFILPAVAVIVYATVAVNFYIRRPLGDRIVFYGPIMAIKTFRVGFLDTFLRFRSALKVYGTIGAFMVVVVSIFMTFSLLLIFPQFISQPPPPTGIHDPRNILAIPGLNQAIPFTLAVWLGLLLTIFVHEFGHGILARVESMRVKSMGVLFAVLPIGAFVEPDEGDVEKAKGISKIRMFGAGIANNLLAALVSFGLLFLLLGYAVPSPVPLVWGYYGGSPAERAGIPPLGIVKEIGGVEVDTIDGAFQALERYAPGDEVAFRIEKGGMENTYLLRVEEWPENMSGKSPVFTGIFYYNPVSVKDTLERSAELGILLPLFLLAVPLNVFIDGNTAGLDILVMDSPVSVAWMVPFPGFFWFMIQALFWCGWFNAAVGIFNALPLLPLDGGYIMKECVERFFERRGWSRYSYLAVSAISSIIAFVILTIIALPILSQFLK
ncbi:MAG: site-2 protease family protein [Methanomicrobiales archaeon]|nr:site-2 protease family protein [Methanomicrobiales archaeon]